MEVLTLSGLASLCSSRIAVHLGKIRYSWTGHVDTQLKIMLGLKDSKSRLDEWIGHLDQAKLKVPSEGHIDSMAKTIGTSLLSLFVQLEALVPPEPSQPDHEEVGLSALVNCILGTDAPHRTLEDRMSSHGVQQLTRDPQKAEEVINDIVTCLCSYKTALRIMSSPNEFSGKSGGAQSSVTLFSVAHEDNHSITDFDFQPGQLERAESDIFKKWSRWEFGTKERTDAQDIVPSRTRSIITPHNEEETGDSNNRSGAIVQLETQSNESALAGVSPNLENKPLENRSADTSSSQITPITVVESSRPTKRRMSKHAQSSASKQIEPPPPYNIAAMDPTPPLGHVCWLGGGPPAYSDAVKSVSGPVPRKLVIVGDGATGKTCANIVFLSGRYPEVYVPTVFDNYYGDLEVDSVHVGLGVFDTAGQEDYDRLRALSYPDSDVIVITYAIDSPASLDDVGEKWIPEVHHFCAGLPILLAGLKADLRDDKDTVRKLKSHLMAPVDFKEGLKMAKKIGADAFVECSALRNQGIYELYGAASRLSLCSAPRLKKKDKCSVM